MFLIVSGTNKTTKRDRKGLQTMDKCAAPSCCPLPGFWGDCFALGMVGWCCLVPKEAGTAGTCGPSAAEPCCVCRSSPPPHAPFHLEQDQSWLWWQHLEEDPIRAALSCRAKLLSSQQGPCSSSALVRAALGSGSPELYNTGQGPWAGVLLPGVPLAPGHPGQGDQA